MLKFSDDDMNLREEEVDIRGELHVLREADGDTASKFQSAAIRGSRFNREAGDITIGDIGDVDLVLLTGCMFKKNVKAGNMSPVPASTIRSWPNRIIKQLVKRAKAMSDLNDAEDDPESISQEIERLQKRLTEIEEDSLGKSSSGSTDGSA